MVDIYSAQTVHNAQQWFVPSPGALSWLDGSPITYSNWASRPQTEAACGHILKDSGFQWEATADCNKKLHFICQFGMYSSDSCNDSEIWTGQPTESLHDDLLLCIAFVFFSAPGRSIVCADHNTTLQCASGQVLIIDSGFYGHKNSHYCRSSFSLPTTSLPHQCGWTDVGQTITGNRQSWFSVCSLKKHSLFTCYNIWVKWSVLGMPLHNTQQLMDLTDTISTLKPPSFIQSAVLIRKFLNRMTNIHAWLRIWTLWWNWTQDKVYCLIALPEKNYGPSGWKNSRPIKALKINSLKDADIYLLAVNIDSCNYLTTIHPFISQTHSSCSRSQGTEHVMGMVHAVQINRANTNTTVNCFKFTWPIQYVLKHIRFQYNTQSHCYID